MLVILLIWLVVKIIQKVTKADYLNLQRILLGALFILKWNFLILLLVIGVDEIVIYSALEF